VLLFCGSGGDALSDGPGCPDQMPAWDDNPNGYMMYFQQYRGGKYRTATFAGELGIPNNVPLILICYSAGSEACLMYAKKRLADGGLVQSVALLGPTFSGKNENGIDLSFEGPNGGWKSYMDELLVNGTDIMIVDDNDGDNFKYALGINSPTAAQGYMPPDSAKGDFLYTYTDAKHWTDHPNWITATNTWDFLSDFTFNTLDAMATP
jgi:hypothetical protein